MNHDQPKGPRKLQLLPEVLPAPTRAAGASDVRSRTVAHMRRMLAAIPSAAGAVALSSGCSHESSASNNTVTIPIASSTGAGAATSTLPPLHPTASATAVPTATAEPDVGYAVVDPMPAPARCLGLAPATKASGALRHDAAGIVLEVSISLPTAGQWQGSAFDRATPPSAWGGQLVTSAFKGASVVSQVRPIVPASGTTTTTVGITFGVACAAGNGTLIATATLTLPLRDGAKVPLSLADY